MQTDFYQWDTLTHCTGGEMPRAVFNWALDYEWVRRRPEDQIYPEKPAPTPIMLGNGFAIRRDYFLDIGGYDEGEFYGF